MSRTTIEQLFESARTFLVGAERAHSIEARDRFCMSAIEATARIVGPDVAACVMSAANAYIAKVKASSEPAGAATSDEVAVLVDALEQIVKIDGPCSYDGNPRGCASCVAKEALARYRSHA